MFQNVTCFCLCFQCDVNLDTNEPLNTLSPECLTWCKSIGSSARTVNEAIADQALLKASSSISYITRTIYIQMILCLSV